MTNHLTDKQFIGYIHHTLTDAEREAIDRHLADCPACRSPLDEHEALQRRIRNDLSADLRQSRPSTRMSFATIAPHIKRKRRLIMFANKSNQALSSAVAIIVLIAVGFGLFYLFNNRAQPEGTAPEQVTAVAVEPAQSATISPTEESQPTELPTVAMFRGNPQRTGVYNDTAGPASGELLWKFETEDNILSSPVVIDGVAYFGSNDRHLYAVNSQTGQELWRFDMGGWVLSPPAVADGVVYAGSGCAGDMMCVDGANQKNRLLALDSQTGQEIWHVTTEMGVSSSPAIMDGTVYFGSYDEHLYAVDSRTGQEVWRFQAEDSIISSPAVVDDIIYFGSGCFQCTLFSEEKSDDFLYAVDRNTGQELWRFKTEGYVESTPAVMDGVVYFGSNDRHLYAVDSRSGQVKWQLKTFGRITTSPAVTGDRVYITSHDRSLYAIDRQTGQEIWRFTTGWPLSSSPLVAAGVVYFGGSGSDGPLYAVDAQTGRELWKFKTDEPIYSSPTIANSVVYIGSEDNHLYAIR